MNRAGAPFRGSGCAFGAPSGTDSEPRVERPKAARTSGQRSGQSAAGMKRARAPFRGSGCAFRAAWDAASEPRVERPKAAGTSGPHGGQSAARMNRARAPFRGSGCAFRAAWDAASEPRVERPKAARTSGQRSGPSAAGMNRAGAPFRGSGCAFRAASGAAEDRGNERSTQRSKRGGDESRKGCRSEEAAARSEPPVERIRSREWSGRRPPERAVHAKWGRNRVESGQPELSPWITGCPLGFPWIDPPVSLYGLSSPGLPPGQSAAALPNRASAT